MHCVLYFLDNLGDRSRTHFSASSWSLLPALDEHERAFLDLTSCSLQPSYHRTTSIFEKVFILPFPCLQLYLRRSAHSHQTAYWQMGLSIFKCPEIQSPRSLLSNCLFDRWRLSQFRILLECESKSGKEKISIISGCNNSNFNLLDSHFSWFSSLIPVICFNQLALILQNSLAAISLANIFEIFSSRKWMISESSQSIY